MPVIITACRILKLRFNDVLIAAVGLLKLTACSVWCDVAMLGRRQQRHVYLFDLAPQRLHVDAKSSCIHIGTWTVASALLNVWPNALSDSLKIAKPVQLFSRQVQWYTTKGTAPCCPSLCCEILRITPQSMVRHHRLRLFAGQPQPLPAMNIVEP